MIPAGYENRHHSQDFYDSDEDDDDFDFEFSCSDVKNEKAPQAIQSIEKSKENFSNYSNTKNVERSLSNNEINYDFNNDKMIHYDESDFLLDDLKNAIVQNNVELVKILFEKQKFDVDLILKNNWTSLMYAVSSGSLELTKYFIDNGADVNFADDSYSILLCACGSPDLKLNENVLIEIVELLISKGADVNYFDKYYQTPLIYACRSGNSCLIESLVKSNADINAQDDNDWTSLAYACSKGYIQCVKKLLQLGADPTLYTIDYLYPIDLAENNGYHNVKLLIKNFMRTKRIEKLKNSSNNTILSEGFFDDDEENNLCENIELGTFQAKKENEDLENFLKILRLSDLVKLFNDNKIKMTDLLNFKDEDLKNIGIIDNYIRQLILCEVKKFHQKNWKSNSLIPCKQEAYLNCNEAIAIVSNLARHMDFMNTNIKFLSSEAKENNSDLFSDKFLSAKLLKELKQTVINSKELFNQAESFFNFAQQKIDEPNALPIDLIKKKEPQKWYKNPQKLVFLTSIGIASAYLTLNLIK